MRTTVTALLPRRRSRIATPFLDSFARTAEQNLKRVSLPPTAIRLPALIVYSLYGRQILETTGLKFETQTGEIK